MDEELRNNDGRRNILLENGFAIEDLNLYEANRDNLNDIVNRLVSLREIFNLDVDLNDFTSVLESLNEIEKITQQGDFYTEGSELESFLRVLRNLKASFNNGEAYLRGQETLKEAQKDLADVEKKFAEWQNEPDDYIRTSQADDIIAERDSARIGLEEATRLAEERKALYEETLNSLNAEEMSTSLLNGIELLAVQLRRLQIDSEVKNKLEDAIYTARTKIRDLAPNRASRIKEEYEQLLKDSGLKESNVRAREEKIEETKTDGKEPQEIVYHYNPSAGTTYSTIREEEKVVNYTEEDQVVIDYFSTLKANNELFGGQRKEIQNFVNGTGKILFSSLMKEVGISELSVEGRNKVMELANNYLESFVIAEEKETELEESAPTKEGVEPIAPAEAVVELAAEPITETIVPEEDPAIIAQRQATEELNKALNKEVKNVFDLREVLVGMNFDKKDKISLISVENNKPGEPLNLAINIDFDFDSLNIRGDMTKEEDGIRVGDMFFQVAVMDKLLEKRSERSSILTPEEVERLMGASPATGAAAEPIIDEEDYKLSDIKNRLKQYISVVMTVQNAMPYYSSRPLGDVFEDYLVLGTFATLVHEFNNPEKNGAIAGVRKSELSDKAKVEVEELSKEFNDLIDTIQNDKQVLAAFDVANDTILARLTTFGYSNIDDIITSTYYKENMSQVEKEEAMDNLDYLINDYKKNHEGPHVDDVAPIADPVEEKEYDVKNIIKEIAIRNDTKIVAYEEPSKVLGEKYYTLYTAIDPGLIDYGEFKYRDGVVIDPKNNQIVLKAEQKLQRSNGLPIISEEESEPELDFDEEEDESIVPPGKNRITRIRRGVLDALARASLVLQGISSVSKKIGRGTKNYGPAYAETAGIASGVTALGVAANIIATPFVPAVAVAAGLGIAAQTIYQIYLEKTGKKIPEFEDSKAYANDPAKASVLVAGWTIGTKKLLKGWQDRNKEIRDTAEKMRNSKNEEPAVATPEMSDRPAEDIVDPEAVYYDSFDEMEAAATRSH